MLIYFVTVNAIPIQTIFDICHIDNYKYGIYMSVVAMTG